jgi:hypothetical protein
VVLQAELLLMAGAAGLYLYDSALLLYFDEGILAPASRGRWRVLFGSDRFRLMGRGLFIPNPLLPHRPLFRLARRFPSSGRAVDAHWPARRALFQPLAPALWAIGAALFVVLPLGLFRLGEPALLVAAVMLYGSIAAALVWTGVNRGRLGLSRRRVAALAFESLACPPFALNLVRRISAAMPIDEDLVRAARALQTPRDWDAARLEFIARLDEEIDAEEEGSARLPVLVRSRRELAECPA